MVERVATYKGYDIHEWPERQGHEKYYPVYCASPEGTGAVMGGSGVTGTFGSVSACKTAIDRKIEPREVPTYSPDTAMAPREYVETYRGVNIYQYTGEMRNYTCKYGSSTDKKTIYYLIDKNLDDGQAPDLQRPSTDIDRDVKDSADSRTDEPHTNEIQPRVCDTYNGVEIVYHPNKDTYYSRVGEREKHAESLDDAHAFIDHEQYVNSNQFQVDQAQKKAEEEEELRKAFLSEEEARAEEAKEAETQGGWLSIYWFKLKSEIQRTVEMLK